MKIKIATILVMVCAFVITACGGNSAAPTTQNSAPPKGSGNTQNGQVVITGAINKTYTPSIVTAFKVGEGMNITLSESFPCGVNLSLPQNMQPGTYPIADYAHQKRGDVTGGYTGGCVNDSEAGIFSSTGGTLNLTATGTSYSGSFQLTAAHTDDKSKIIQVSGSFSNVPLQ